MALQGAHLVLGVDVRPAPQQRLHHLQVTILSGVHESRVAILHEGRQGSRGAHIITPHHHAPSEKVRAPSISDTYKHLECLSTCLIHLLERECVLYCSRKKQVFPSINSIQLDHIFEL